MRPIKDFVHVGVCPHLGQCSYIISAGGSPFPEVLTASAWEDQKCSVPSQVFDFASTYKKPHSLWL